MSKLQHLGSGLEHFGAMIKSGGEGHDRFWTGMKRMHRSIDRLGDKLSRHCDGAFAAMVGGICSLFALAMYV